ncbi:unnamed protein product [Vitrella brassicaformis CCMP3155]|uniref:Uncharacterized protein n=2 Tax=Vitrella brassicaformis TaxID=1169539 RepID=A0A0G4G2R9_VITBC|nr:unnamed protein product [Vitrella brassicaformis CCMP3155]|eukprot:CEM21984.1 unnamed protein product [Vitrella brassicaformis CCMP3155]
MVAYFRQRPPRDSTVNLEVKEWPAFASKEDIVADGHVPAVVWKYGPDRRVCLPEKEILELAFDEPDGHLSHLFSGRLYRLHVGQWIEECIVQHVQADPLDKHLYFVKFQRHVPGRMTQVSIPVSLIGLLGCPAYLKGYHVELVMPTVECEVVGDHIPPPFLLDVSKLHFKSPYSAITLRDMLPLLPSDGTVRFSRKYDLDRAEVCWTYEVGKIPEVPLPKDWRDPNFIDRKGKLMRLTYRNFWPSQGQER